MKASDGSTSDYNRLPQRVPVANQRGQVMFKSLNRRQAIAAATVLAGSFTVRADDTKSADGPVRHSICRWCYNKIPLDRLCEVAKSLGYHSIELLNPPDVLIVKKHSLTCAVLMGGPS